MTNETLDTGEAEAFDDETAVTPIAANPLARDVGDLAVSLSTLASLAAEASRRLQCATAREQALILRGLVQAGRDGADGIHDRMRCYDDILRAR